MVEKKAVLEGLKLAYNGPFDVSRLISVIDEWIAKKGKEKEIKAKREEVTEKGKSIEWAFEIWEDIKEHARNVIRIRVLITGLREEKVKIKGVSRKANAGDVLVIFDGWLETDYEGKWEGKPWYFFLKWMFERYIYRYHQNRYDGLVAGDIQELYDVLKNFFESYSSYQKV